MARRARSSPTTTWLLTGLALLLVLVAVVASVLHLAGVSLPGGFSGQPFRSSPEFPVEQYLGEATTLRGNTYRISGKVLNSIAWSPEQGRLISVQPSGSKSPVPVVLPPDLSGTNIQKGDEFHLRVEVRENGVLYATGLAKTTGLDK